MSNSGGESMGDPARKYLVTSCSSLKALTASLTLILAVVLNVLSYELLVPVSLFSYGIPCCENFGFPLSADLLTFLRACPEATGPISL